MTSRIVKIGGSFLVLAGAASAIPHFFPAHSDQSVDAIAGYAEKYMGTVPFQVDGTVVPAQALAEFNEGLSAALAREKSGKDSESIFVELPPDPYWGQSHAVSLPAVRVALGSVAREIAQKNQNASPTEAQIAAARVAQELVDRVGGYGAINALKTAHCTVSVNLQFKIAPEQWLAYSPVIDLNDEIKSPCIENVRKFEASISKAYEALSKAIPNATAPIQWHVHQLTKYAEQKWGGFEIPSLNCISANNYRWNSLFTNDVFGKITILPDSADVTNTLAQMRRETVNRIRTVAKQLGAPPIALYTSANKDRPSTYIGSDGLSDTPPTPPSYGESVQAYGEMALAALTK